jgi:sigma-B regulation protein RsbU (phosphoserine phosphatase)
MEDFTRLVREYKKLLRQTKKLVSIGDRTQRELLQTREELQKQYDTIDTQLNLAVEYVISLLPEDSANDDFEIYSKFIPSEKLGGDVYGYHYLDEHRIAIYLIDVCGHGIGPALHSVSVLNTLKSQSLTKTDFFKPDEVMAALNRTYLMTDYHDMYFTMWYCVYDIESKKISCCGAGHPPILVNGKNGLKLLESQNAACGILPDFPFSTDEVQLEEGDSLFIYSDGAYEVEISKDVFLSHTEMAEFLIKSSQKGDNEELTNLYNHLLKIGSTEKLEDDFTIMKFFVK